MDAGVYLKCARKSKHMDEHNFSALCIYDNPCNMLFKKKKEKETVIKSVNSFFH